MSRSMLRIWVARIGVVVASIATISAGSAGVAMASATPAGAITAGPSWQVQTLPGLHAGDELSAVSCSSPTFCMAVGNGTETHRVVAEAYNGSAWRSVPMVNPTHPSSSYSFGVSGVSCSSSTACVAVGAIEGRTDLHTLAEVWNGKTWSKTTPVFAGNLPTLDAVSCPASKTCVAVGHYEAPNGGFTGNLAEVWNGTTWKRVLHARSPGSGLDSISCAGASLCFAGGLEPGLQQWNGTRWRTVDTGAVSSREIACSSATSCVAIGCTSAFTCAQSGPQNSFVWNGSAWKQATTNGAKRQSQLRGLSCPSATSCYAAGGLAGSSTNVIGHFNGHYWTIQRNPGEPGLHLQATSCTGDACEVIGFTVVNGVGVAAAALRAVI